MGLIGVPLVVPLLCGVLWRRPKPWGAIASIVAGIAAGFFLKGLPGFNWESATFCQMLICLDVLFISGVGESRNAAYRQRVAAFFKRLATPVCESEGAVAASPHAHRAIMTLFAVTLGLSGLLFVGISLFNFALPSGRMTLAAGTVCCALAGGLGWRVRRRS